MSYWNHTHPANRTSQCPASTCTPSRPFDNGHGWVHFLRLHKRKDAIQKSVKWWAYSRPFQYINPHDKGFLSPPQMKMAAEPIAYFFLVHTCLYAFVRVYSPIFGMYFHGNVASHRLPWSASEMAIRCTGWFGLNTHHQFEVQFSKPFPKDSIVGEIIYQ